jgi:anti-sigma factor RsiW
MEQHENCREMLGSLSDYVDGSLNEAVCDELERHIANCENCRIVVDTLRKTVYLYHVANDSVSVPAGVRQRLYKRLNLEDMLEQVEDE